MIKRIIKTGDEQDAYTGFRKYLCYMSRPGVVKGIKKRTNRRERREGLLEIDAQLRDYPLED